MEETLRIAQSKTFTIPVMRVLQNVIIWGQWCKQCILHCMKIRPSSSTGTNLTLNEPEAYANIRYHKWEERNVQHNIERRENLSELWNSLSESTIEIPVPVTHWEMWWPWCRLWNFTASLCNNCYVFESFSMKGPISRKQYCPIFYTVAWE